ncbi:hypothetical protein [Actinacidiphila sp. ITFR-21]|uniref:hypothetical protein n=1 Tax=Actinacidiphila sp. ITFR-21 TaxID=3075199 RepID=UPI00288BE030|nr:hypothetical protein [Streptomyces sp. ITFR-21]WNI20343.1 hypothetical protein RLT57_32590 [Streptomyces sp. ITFR-21]
MATQAPEIVLEALAYGITGDLDAGLELLQPLVDAGPRSTYALLATLAETCAVRAQMVNVDGTQYGIEVEGPDGPASVDDLAPHVRFAIRFVTAWINRDRDTAMALFWAVGHHADGYGTDDLANAIRCVYEMAVADAEVVLIAKRRRAESQ